MRTLSRPTSFAPRRVTAGLAMAALSALALAGPSSAQSVPDAPLAEPPRAAPGPAARPPAPEAPKPETRAETLKRLYDELAKTSDPAAAEPIVRSIEQIWLQTESPTAMLLLNRALIAAQEKNFDLALHFLDSVTELYPDWAEGFNRRAYIYVIKLDYGRALGDLRRVLALDPGNFRALEGLVQVLRTMGQDKAALDVVRTLLKAHPYSPGAQETLKELEEAVEGRGI
jgi:tetratricopeptide (TPR) repeat protein